MPNPRLGTRYAKALLDLSIEQNNTEQVYNDILWLQAVTKSNRDFVNLLRSPVIKADKKISIVKAIAGNILGTLTTAFVELMIKKGREAALPEVLPAFVAQYKEYKKIDVVKLTTAVVASDAIKNNVIAKLKSLGGFNTIELEEVVDPSIIGGFILQYGDQLIDASIAYDLRLVARRFENNDYIYKVR